MSEEQLRQEANKQRFIPITNQSVIDLIKNESTNIKKVNEIFDFAYDNIIYNKKNDMITMKTKDGDTLHISLESHISKEIMDYAYDMKYLVD